MTFLLSCPNCGTRDVNEFAYSGEVSTRPTGSPSQRELGNYLYFRANVAGVQREWWCHRLGCELWFTAERDTRTNEVLRTELPPSRQRAGAPAPTEPAVPDTPAV